MGYYGGLGSGKGWLTYSFIVEADLLRELLLVTNSVLVVTNTRVPTEYISTPLEEYIAKYARYLEALLKTADSADKATFGLRIGLAPSLNQFSSRTCPDDRYKLMDTDEPVVNLSPLSLHFDARRGQLCTNVMSKLYFGIDMTFPRVITLDRDEHKVYYDTDQFASYQIYQNVKSQVQKVTKPCKIRSTAKEHRTKIRISDAMRKRINQHPGLKAAGLKVV